MTHQINTPNTYYTKLLRDEFKHRSTLRVTSVALVLADARMLSSHVSYAHLASDCIYTKAWHLPVSYTHVFAGCSRPGGLCRGDSPIILFRNSSKCAYYSSIIPRNYPFKRAFLELNAPYIVPKCATSCIHHPNAPTPSALPGRGVMQNNVSRSS